MDLAALLVSLVSLGIVIYNGIVVKRAIRRLPK